MDSEYKELMGGKNIADAIKAASKAHGVGFQAGTITIKEETARNLFKPVVQAIIDHVRQLLRNEELNPCELFFLVGGFSESKYLQEMIKREFQPRIQVCFVLFHLFIFHNIYINNKSFMLKTIIYDTWQLKQWNAYATCDNYSLSNYSN